MTHLACWPSFQLPPLDTELHAAWINVAAVASCSWLPSFLSSLSCISLGVVCGAQATQRVWSYAILCETPRESPPHLLFHHLKFSLGIVSIPVTSWLANKPISVCAKHKAFILPLNIWWHLENKNRQRQCSYLLMRIYVVEERNNTEEARWCTSTQSQN